MPSTYPLPINKHDIQFLLDAPQRSSQTQAHTSNNNYQHLHYQLGQQHDQQRRAIVPLASTASSHHKSSFPASVSNLEFRGHSPVSPVSTPSLYSSQTTTRSSMHHSPASSSSPPGGSTNTCKECGSSFASSQQLASHIRAAHRLKPFACKLCDKTFAERGNANKHYRVAHLKQRNHRCATCDRCFAFRDGLNRHISMVHLNERPFECTECMCPGGPHNSDVACTHICGMRFKQKSHRRRHVLSVHHAARRSEEHQASSQSSSFSSLPHLRLPPHRSQQVP